MATKPPEEQPPLSLRGALVGLVVALLVILGGVGAVAAQGGGDTADHGDDHGGEDDHGDEGDDHGDDDDHSDDES